MSGERQRGLADAFDDLLDQGRRRLDDLYGAPSDRPGRTGRTSPVPSAPSSASGPSTSSAATRSTAAAAPALPPGSAVAATLDQRYGDAWRYEVLDRHRDGGEMVVLCRLSVGDGGSQRSQFGRAEIGGGKAPRLGGSAGGVAFSFGDAAAGPGDGEARATARAIEAALESCLRLL